MGTKDGIDEVEADLTFRTDHRTDPKKRDVSGTYSLKGQVHSEGRSLTLNPVPDSWKEQPENFVMVGLQGVVSHTNEQGRLRYAGIVPIFGCDSFELSSGGAS